MPRVQVCTVSDVENNTMRRFLLNGREILVAKISNRYYATNERCTHRGGPLSEGRLEGPNVTCPLHFGEFNLQTGDATGPPASDPLQTYRVSVDGEHVYLDLP